MSATKEDNMKSKKGSVELIFIVLLGLMIWVGSGRTDAQKAQSRADVEKSFGQPKGNVITKFTTYGEMTDAQKKEFDKMSADSPTYW